MSRHANTLQHSVLALTALVLMTASAAHATQLFVTTEGDGDRMFVIEGLLDDPPQPVVIEVQGLAGARPHGGAYIRSGRALISDFFRDGVFVVDTDTASTLSRIDTAGLWNGTGSIRVSPDGRTALAFSWTRTNIAVLREPYMPGMPFGSLETGRNFSSFQTDGIVFADSGRAFVRSIDRIHLIDPPYTQLGPALLAPTRPSSGTNFFSGALAISADGQRLLGTDLIDSLDVYLAPHVNGQAPSRRIPLGFGAGGTSQGADGIILTPDEQFAIVVNAFLPQIAVVSDPFGADPQVQLLDLPAPLLNGCGAAETSPCPGFEDLDISPDGSLIVVTGNSSHLVNGVSNPTRGRAPLALVRRAGNQFTVEALRVGNSKDGSHGRGTGTVRFISERIAARLFEDGFESVDSFDAHAGSEEPAAESPPSSVDPG